MAKGKKFLAGLLALGLLSTGLASCNQTDDISSDSTVSTVVPDSSTTSSSISSSTIEETTPDQRRTEWEAVAANGQAHIQGTVVAIERFSSGSNYNLYVQDGNYGYRVTNCNLLTTETIEVGKTYSIYGGKKDASDINGSIEVDIKKVEEVATVAATPFELSSLSSEVIAANAGLGITVTDAEFVSVTGDKTSSITINLRYNETDLAILSRGATVESIYNKFTNCVEGDKITIKLGVITTGSKYYVYDPDQIEVTLVERQNYSGTAVSASTLVGEGTGELTHTVEGKTISITGGEVKANEKREFIFNIAVTNPTNLTVTDEITATADNNCTVTASTEGTTTTFAIATYEELAAPATITLSVKWANDAGENRDVYTVTVGEGVTYEQLVEQNSVTLDLTTLSTTGADATNDIALSAFDTLISNTGGLVTSVSSLSKVYAGKAGYGLKFSSSKAAGTVTFNLSEAVTQVKVTVIRYNTGDAVKVSVNGTILEATDATETESTVLTYDLSEASQTITVAAGQASKCRFYITAIELVK